ncbi:hypothetical protein IC235_06130 [Hymenobacter sp. BT664]|uniref:Uncharacterized protein n=1 Tax=Hymenobacter montanus TaxID=2771359 RepID=A0A927BB35_9BACT|nr:hypothetical protein [Hymenobacter montanus]MBD2767467.1 hypothetical protein [Hymenobacter montanus]
MEENALLEVSRSQLIYGPGAEVVSILLSKWGIEAPFEVINFYGEVEEASFEWRLKDSALIDHLDVDNPFISGNIKIQSLADSLWGYNRSKGWKDVIWFENTDQEDLAFYQSIRPFDFFFTDAGEIACFQVENGKFAEKLFLFGHEAGWTEMNIGVKEYVELLTQTRGMFNWQEALVFKCGKNKTRLKHYLPRLFNDVNLEGF